MDTRQLELFISVAHTLNFSQTAKKYYLTQPAVSHKIKMLEEELGASLLYREGHTVSLTEEGIMFLHYAMNIVNMEYRVRNIISKYGHGRTGFIKIAAIPTLSEELSNCISILSDEYPQLQVVIDQMEGYSFIKAFVDDEYDFYFGANKMFVGAKGYSSVITKHTELKLFVNKNIAETIDLSDWSTISCHPFVSVNPSDTVLSAQVKEICHNKEFEPNIVNYYNRVELVPLSINAGIGISILPAALETAFYYPNIVTFPIEDEVANIYHLIAWKKLRNSACIKFEKIIKELYMDE